MPQARANMQGLADEGKPMSQKTILVTGASSGLGAHFAAVLARDGARVILAARSEGKIADQVGAIRDAGGTALAVAMDVADPGSVAAGFAQVEGRIDVVVNNAGLLQLFDLTEPVANARVLAEVTTNLIAPIHLGSLLVPHLRRQPAAAAAMAVHRRHFSRTMVITKEDLAHNSGKEGYSLTRRTRSSELPEFCPPVAARRRKTSCR